MALRITELYRPDLSTPLALRLFLCRVPAGFPSPADDYIDEFLDLNKKLITNKSATFLVRAEGHSMKGGRYLFRRPFDCGQLAQARTRQGGGGQPQWRARRQA